MGELINLNEKHFQDFKKYVSKYNERIIKFLTDLFK